MTVNGKHASHEDALNNTLLGEYTYYSPSQPEISSKKSENFSVGVFQVAWADGKRVSRPTVMRISGPSDESDDVYRKAEYAVARLNESKDAAGVLLEELVKKIERELEYL